jgi:hypothetical protein
VIGNPQKGREYFTETDVAKGKKVKQSRYRPGVVQRVPGI